MKTPYASLLVFMLFISSAVRAQHFWVIEYNPKQSTETVFKVYDSQNALVHEETLQGKLLNLASRHDRKFLNKKMKEAISQKTIASTRRANRTKKG